MSREVLITREFRTKRAKLKPLYLYELAIRAPPLLDVVRPSAGKHEQLGMGHEPSHRLLVVGQRGDRLSCSQVPQADCGVIAGSDYLRVGCLAEHARHRVCVAGQRVDVHLN